MVKLCILWVFELHNKAVFPESAWRVFFECIWDLMENGSKRCKAESTNPKTAVKASRRKEKKQVRFEDEIKQESDGNSKDENKQKDVSSKDENKEKDINSKDENKEKHSNSKDENKEKDASSKDENKEKDVNSKDENKEKDSNNKDENKEKDVKKGNIKDEDTKK